MKLLARQLKDIIAQADRIIDGDKSYYALEMFSRSSSDLKDYIKVNIRDRDIQACIYEIPHVNYSRTRVRFWQYLILPLVIISYMKDYVARNQTVEEVIDARNKYSNLELLLRTKSIN